MKKYFTKITAILLLAIIFPMVSGFCFQGLLGPMVKVNVAQAASYDNSSVSDMGVCSAEQSAKQTQAPAKSSNVPNHHNPVLPCCVDGSHSSNTNLSQLFESGKSVMAVSFISENQLPKPAENLVSYRLSTSSPPESPLVLKTILRL